VRAASAHRRLPPSWAAPETLLEQVWLRFVEDRRVSAVTGKSPWLNRIEPHWMHGKRKIVEPARLLTGQELADRVCAHFGRDHGSDLAVTQKAA
jgi:hypothetical protein